MLDVAKQAVDVFASDNQAPLLWLVQFPWAPRPPALRFWFGHDSSSRVQSSMHNHHRTMRILQNPLRIRPQHPAVKNRVAALAQDNEAGLDGVRAMKNLFRRMADDDIGFQFNLQLLRSEEHTSE